MNPISVNLWAILGGVLIVLALLVGVGRWQNEAGHVAERTAWQERENKELVAANDEITRLNFEAVEKEKKHLLALDAIATEHQTEIAKNENQKQRDIADARSGALGLRFTASCKGAGESGGSKVGASTGVSDGGTEVELSREITGALYEIANDADRNTDQLRAAQAVIAEDRRLCGLAP